MFYLTMLSQLQSVWIRAESGKMIVSNSMEQSPSEAYSRPQSQKISHLLQNWKIDYRTVFTKSTSLIHRQNEFGTQPPILFI
jgi:hypothetical protein